ncbi:MAG: hypothetical protein DIZ78_00705 [endosymbiont of Escarpia spicata]|uniref:Uncharacterized protein n=1 Tax=endosymbiont of Escarpia spicata TaxID=2200908 RepID=A0A370DTC0_9GAMM|nr:MAG: hypothetical protein DIZ78_00705 [endosymbiont of Escarpia spicata]
MVSRDLGTQIAGFTQYDITEAALCRALKKVSALAGTTLSLPSWYITIQRGEADRMVTADTEGSGRLFPLTFGFSNNQAKRGPIFSASQCCLKKRLKNKRIIWIRTAFMEREEKCVLYMNRTVYFLPEMWKI